MSECHTTGSVCLNSLFLRQFGVFLGRISFCLFVTYLVLLGGLLCVLVRLNRFLCHILAWLLRDGLVWLLVHQIVIDNCILFCFRELGSIILKTLFCSLLNLQVPSLQFFYLLLYWHSCLFPIFDFWHHDLLIVHVLAWILLSFWRSDVDFLL